MAPPENLGLKGGRDARVQTALPPRPFTCNTQVAKCLVLFLLHSYRVASQVPAVRPGWEGESSARISREPSEARAAQDLPCPRLSMSKAQEKQQTRWTAKARPCMELL